jgi:hypothetical protein
MSAKHHGSFGMKMILNLIVTSLVRGGDRSGPHDSEGQARR